MRQFWTVTSSVAGNFILWSLLTKLPVHAMILFCLVIAVGCLMLYSIVRFGAPADNGSSTRSKF